ncbi:hypothetical protein Snoj_43100 [Streptomyces nojiriensis]|uniref:Uncharacterized protein n=1 Tax=Streptomyces nojiriensis TaxID=66374 RepID=A0ABQ3SQI3_9ACTN|nr:hypothetical protein [Streptomyces nojiriensis]QTI43925.1 hypothetical protein JYK04_01688 [Streptomyces nojiriensis]GGR84890.1 hypothetical protein GCM10010205_11760 [Streptomyces nojiriensis]GHI70392.1 hypothetical protein Snoj_43100 [Streptomyces nojiriensis]
MRKLTCYITATLDRAAQRFDTLATGRAPHDPHTRPHGTGEPVTRRRPAVIGSGIPLFDRRVTPTNPARAAARTIDSGLTVTHFSRGLS